MEAIKFIILGAQREIHALENPDGLIAANQIMKSLFSDEAEMLVRFKL